MINKIADGKTARYVASNDIVSGGIAFVGEKPGVAVNPIAAGEEGVLDMEGGVFGFTLGLATDAEKAQGLKVYVPGVESDGDDLTLSAGAGTATNILLGYLEEKVASGAKAVKVRLVK